MQIHIVVYKTIKFHFAISIPLLRNGMVLVWATLLLGGVADGPAATANTISMTTDGCLV